MPETMTTAVEVNTSGKSGQIHKEMTSLECLQMAAKDWSQYAKVDTANKVNHFNCQLAVLDLSFSKCVP